MLDEKIVDLYWARSEDAISETSKKYGRLCHSIAYGILKSDEDAEECVSDTYMRAWNSMPTSRPNRLKAFLGKITRNLALDRYDYNKSKMRGGGQMSAVLEELAECVSGEDCTEEVLDKIIFDDLINRFLREQSAQMRNIFLSRYWLLMPNRDIARKYSLSESSVDTALHRMRGSLRLMLEKEEIL